MAKASWMKLCSVHNEWNRRYRSSALTEMDAACHSHQRIYHIQMMCFDVVVWQEKSITKQTNILLFVEP